MIDEEFMVYARSVREHSYRLGVAVVEEEEVLHVYSLVFAYAASVREDVTFTELGAGVGYVSLWAAKALDDACSVKCRVVAVEPRRRLAEKASTILHSYRFKRVGLKVVANDPVEVLRNFRDYSVDVVFVNTGLESLPRLTSILKSKLVVGGMVIVPRVYGQSISEDVFEAISLPMWRKTIVPVGRGLLLLVRVDGAGEAE